MLKDSVYHIKKGFWFNLPLEVGAKMFQQQKLKTKNKKIKTCNQYIQYQFAFKSWLPMENCQNSIYFLNFCMAVYGSKDGSSFTQMSVHI